MGAATSFDRRSWTPVILLVGIAALLASPTSRANETDQFLLPIDREMADVGAYLSNVHYRVLDDFVQRVEEARRQGRRLSDEDVAALRRKLLHAME